VNHVDSARVVVSLLRAGHEQVFVEGEADSVIVNTCGVTAESERRCRRVVRAAVGFGRQVLVMGCAPKVSVGGWCGGVDGVEVLGTVEGVCEKFGSVDCGSLCDGDRTRPCVVVQWGCDNVCSYCAVRGARGSHFSVPVADVVHAVRGCATVSAEVVLAGINLAAWGCERTTEPSGSRVSELIDAILTETEVRRLRLSSLGPQFLGTGFFRVFAQERVCDHLHLSVQSGSESVLARMCRGYGVGEVEWIVREARRVRPYVAVTGDFIVGFPGETEADFSETMSFAQRLGFAQLHVFPFSARDGTVAAGMADQVSASVKKDRARRLIDLGGRLRSEFVGAQEGRVVSVVVLRDGTGVSTNGLRFGAVGGCVGDVVDCVIDPRMLC